MKDYKRALEALNESSIYAELIIKSERNQALFELETQYDLENKNSQILLEQEKTNASNIEIEDKKHDIKLILLIVILLCIILVISVAAFYKSRKSNLLLSKTVHQKEILLQEVHHRVKNNLTLLNSLLYLRGEASRDKKVVDVLNECQARVQTMSMVHQNLYDVDDASKVDFKKFIEELIVESTSIMDCFDKKINTDIDTNNLFLEMGSAVFLGLILNELITNSLKYAFNEDKTHSISVDLTKVKSEYTLTYSDSGPGLPKSFDLKNTSGFGFQLINIMVNQIDGKLEYLNESNTFSIKFKL